MDPMGYSFCLLKEGQILNPMAMLVEGKLPLRIGWDLC